MPTAVSSRCLPLHLALAYLGGTFALFLAFGAASQVPDLPKLCVYVLATLAALAAGYLLRITRARPGETAPVWATESPIAVQLLIAACATYYLLAAYAYLRSQTAIGDFGGLVAAVTDPAGSYFGRLHSADSHTATPLLHATTALAVLYVLLIPLAATHWGRIGWPLRLYVSVGVAAYTCYYLAVGTTKGLGDLAVFGATAVLVCRARRNPRPTWTVRRKAALAAAALVVASYWTLSLAARIDYAGQQAMFTGNPIVVAVVGQHAASGLGAAAFYPTHGYLGLGYSLEAPFVWTGGLGASPAAATWWAESTGDDSAIVDRYTARTAILSGWPDGMYWSTIYPWLASDLTFPGAVAFMGVVGWFLAKFWVEAVAGRLLSFALLTQLALLIVFVPANNQLGQGRPSLIAFATLAMLSVWDRLIRRVRRGDEHDRVERQRPPLPPLEPVRLAGT